MGEVGVVALERDEAQGWPRGAYVTDVLALEEGDDRFVVVARAFFVVVLVSALAIGELEEAMVEATVGRLDEEDLLPRRAGFGPRPRAV